MGNYRLVDNTLTLFAKKEDEIVSYKFGVKFSVDSYVDYRTFY